MVESRRAALTVFSKGSFPSEIGIIPFPLIIAKTHIIQDVTLIEGDA